MTALGRELDNLEVARQEVLDSQLDITEKQKKLTAIDKKINAAEAEAPCAIGTIGTIRLIALLAAVYKGRAVDSLAIVDATSNNP